MSDSDTTVADIGVQPSFDFDLPDFEGVKPVGVVTRLNGAGERIVRPMHYEEKVVLVVEAEVTGVGHGKTSAGMKRVHTLAVRDVYEVEGKPGRRILNALRQAYRTAEDRRNARTPLPLERTGAVLGPSGWTDEHGNALSERDLAEIRGEELLVSLNDGSLDPVALVFADGTRRLWPDDFDGGTARPAAGEMIDDLQVREVLDASTGETVEEWTDEQEDARLAELEEQALAEEAAGNAEAMTQIDQGRSSGVKVTPEHIDSGEVGCRSCSRQLGRAHLKACQYADPFVGLPSANGGERKADPEVEPWDGYENEAAKDIVVRVGGMDDRDAVFVVASWEEDHGGRKTILEACGRRAAELLGGAS